MASSTELSQMQKETIRTVQWHLLPILMIGMICAFLDRINIGFAGLKMNADLGLSPAAFGLAAGAFFIGYFLFEVPSNLMMAKFGPRKWLTRIMFTWGIVAALTAFSGNKYGLYTFRFLLGVAEAGFFPGLVLYITYFFRTEDHAQAVGFLFLGSVAGIIIGGPLSGWLLGMTALGFRGWQWLFIVEGLMPIVYAVVLWFYLPDTPEKAKWLKPEQKEWLVKVIAEENAKKETPKHIGVFQALTRPGTMLFFLVYFLTGIGYLGQQLWMPQLSKSRGQEPLIHGDRPADHAARLLYRDHPGVLEPPFGQDRREAVALLSRSLCRGRRPLALSGRRQQHTHRGARCLHRWPWGRRSSIHFLDRGDRASR